MKHIKLFENFSSIEEELKKYNITDYTINDDGSIDVNGDVHIESAIPCSCGGQSITKIPFDFGRVSGDFHCHTIGLTSLIGSPKVVGGSFYCSSNNLSSLIGSPEEVGGNFHCHFNKLSNLIGSPEEVGGRFICHDNKLFSLEGMPFEIGGIFSCINNPNLKELDSISNIEGEIYCDKSVDVSKFKGYCKEIIIKE